MLYNRLLPLVVPLSVWGLMEAFVINHNFIYFALSAINLLILLSFYFFCRSSDIDKAWWNYALLPMLFSTSIVIYSILLKNNFLIQSLFVLNLLVLYFYLRYGYYYLIQPSAYKISAIENISSNVNFLSFFFFAATLYGLQSFLDIPVWQLMVAILVLSLLLFYQLAWSHKIRLKEAARFLAIGSLVLGELAWAVSFLPLNYHIAGLTLAIYYYMMTGLSRLQLLGRLEAAKVRLFIVLGLSSLVVILLTARWL